MPRRILIRPFVSLAKCLLLPLILGTVVIAASAAPCHVLIRVPAGRAIPPRLTGLLAEWRQAGEIARVLWLTGGRAEHEGNTARLAGLAVLDFTDEQTCASWTKTRAPLLPKGLIVRVADIVADGELPRDSRQSVFVVNTYTPIVPRARYEEFVRGYIAPLYDAERATGHLVRTTMYLERGEIGQADAIAVLEYCDRSAFDAMATEKSKLRDQLMATVPTYAKFDPIKDQLRKDGKGTSVTYTEIPPPRAPAQ